MNDKPAPVGFIGLGTMGFPMAENLISKLPQQSKLFVYDVSAESVDKFKAKFPEAVVPCGSAREVTEQSVSTKLEYHEQRALLKMKGSTLTTSDYCFYHGS